MRTPAFQIERQGGWKNKEEARQCVMCSEGEEESVEHVLLRCTAYRSDCGS